MAGTGTAHLRPDGDVVLHALSDALLGAAALGDIGKHFPDTDPTFKGADSRVLLRHVVGLIHAKGWKVGKERMKDWQAAVRNWKASGYGQGGIAKAAAVDAKPRSYASL